MGEGYRVKKDGKTFWASVVLTALHDDKNNLIGFSKITRDLTERKKSEDSLKQYTEELEFRNRELEQFAFIASHDLQEPLRVIQMYSQLFDKKEADADTYISKIQAAARRMQELIKSVLNYSRLTTSTDKFVKTDLNSTLHNVLLDYDLMITERKGKITSEKLPEIDGIPIQLHQLFSNLISNSLKFAKNDPVINISSATLKANDMAHYPFLNPSVRYIELQFSDNGIGFNQEYADKIFEVFQRLHEKSEYSGTGVGLALCKKIVANHHGYIYAKGMPGEGSVFYVYLPVRQ